MLDWLKEAAVWIVNQLIQSFADAVGAVVGLLPNMPSVPSLGLPAAVQTWFDFGGYWFPTSYMITVLIPLAITLWVGWMALAIIFRWAKAVRGTQ